jgi:nucleotide-binding universal stress UspA family protein
MIEIKRILCPIDFSDHARLALDHAVAVARWYESSLTLLHVCAAIPVAAYAPGTLNLPSAVLTPADRDVLLASMRRLAADEGVGDLPVHLEVVEGNTVGEILFAAERLQSDLLVMGTHGRSGFERLVLGSVTEKVLRKAGCPVLSVPRGTKDAVPATPVVFKEILCAIDFSDCSMNALNYAMSLAQETDARLTVLHVLELTPDWPPRAAGEVEVWSQRITDYIAAAEQDRRERLAAAVPDRVRAYCTVETVMANGTPYREILRVAEERASGLIVIGIHGRSAADVLFFGSTAQHVVRRATCPVLTIRMG